MPEGDLRGARLPIPMETTSKRKKTPFIAGGSCVLLAFVQDDSRYAARFGDDLCPWNGPLRREGSCDSLLGESKTALPKRAATTNTVHFKMLCLQLDRSNDLLPGANNDLWY